jgi:hypothetical protein
MAKIIRRTWSSPGATGRKVTTATQQHSDGVLGTRPSRFGDYYTHEALS